MKKKIFIVFILIGILLINGCNLLNPVVDKASTELDELSRVNETKSRFMVSYEENIPKNTKVGVF